MHTNGQQGLYHPAQEHDACGVGFVVNVRGTRDHRTVEDGMTILCNLEHRGARGRRRWNRTCSAPTSANCSR